MIIQEDYVLGRVATRPTSLARSVGHVGTVRFLKERYAGEETLDLAQAYRTRVLANAEERLDELHRSGYGKGFKVMKLSIGVTTVPR